MRNDSRATAIQQLRTQPNISVLIVGAGINGIGLFRELALQGIDVLLIDRSDFSAGASAASSHMAHGGLRYLENGEFRLVREALDERNRLLQNAPHHVKPLPTTIPIFGWFSGMLNAPLKFLRLRDKPGERGALTIKIGLTLYDWFTHRQQTLPRHKLISRKKSLQLRPTLNPAIVCTATYYDAWMPIPERICLELILDTEALSTQAKALNYVSLQGGEGDKVILRDELSGETLEIKPKIVVNATGAWIDFANSALQQPTRFIGGTKGSHLVLDHPELHAATLGNELFFENKDGRICLFFPLLDRVLVGTTDIPIENPDEAECSEAEIDYMLDMIRLVFPAIKIDRSHIVFCFSGVRPLPYSDAATPGQISRDHSIRLTEPGNNINYPIYSLVGGKWTTFRAFAEQAADQILLRLQKTRQQSTHHMPIGGGKNYPHSTASQAEWINALQQQTHLPQARLQTLFERYGTRAAEIAAFMAADEDKPLLHHPDYSQREILFLATCEKVIHLDDLLLRRTLLAMLGKVTLALIEEIAPLVGQALDWSDQQIRQEIARTIEMLSKKHRMRNLI